MQLLRLAIAYAAIAFLVALFGTLHVDEGHYHAVGALVREGKLPYRDFIYVQAPVYPYVAAALQTLAGPGFVAVRLGHAFLGLVTVVLGGLLARKGGSLGLALYAALLLPNLFTVYHLTFIKLYPVAALFLTLSLVLFERDGLGWQSLAHVSCALAVATRISLLPAFGVMALAGLVLRGRRNVVPVVAGIGALVAIFLPHLVLAPEAMPYDMLTYHFEKDAFTPAQVAIYKLDSLSGIASHFWPALLLAAAVAFGSEPLRGEREIVVWRLLPWVVVGSLVASHLVAKGPNLHLYLTIIYPYAAATLAAGAAGFYERLGQLARPAIWGSLLLFMVVAPAQLRETLTLSAPPPALRVDAAAADVARLTEPGQSVVSFCNSIPVAAGRRNLERYEMNAVSYAWPEARCRQLAILSAKELVAAIDQGDVGACLVTDDSFIGNFPRFYNPGERGIRPDVMAAIERRFELTRTYPGLGYFGKDAYLYVRRQP